ncbi:hypothetical protein HanPSC8_Chr03g0121041 [Helianthus annuus]|nr:hypothetical protein HanPSC8_Chr03g0121041 [Helianthus annuus]
MVSIYNTIGLCRTRLSTWHRLYRFSRRIRRTATKRVLTQFRNKFIIKFPPQPCILIFNMSYIMAAVNSRALVD